MSKLAIARRRASAWVRICDAMAEMREALDYRIWRADINDTHLEADCRTWRELARALAQLLRTKEISK